MTEPRQALADQLLAALARRRATGLTTTAAASATAALAQASEWGAQRALVAADPLLDELGIPAALAAAGVEVLRWPQRPGSDWREPLGLEGPTATVGITVPTLAVAQRGTLVLTTGPGHGRAIDAVSERHLAVLAASRIRPTLAEALAEQFATGRPPAAVSLVSGPSRTSDIEKISTLGAHGALSLHVLAVVDR